MSGKKCPDNVEICSYWIKRKQRRCSHRVADGNAEGLCSEHSATSLEESRKIAEQTKIRSECSFALKNAIDMVVQKCDEICEDGINVDSLSKNRKRSGRKKRTSAPKRMANPFRSIYF